MMATRQGVRKLRKAWAAQLKELAKVWDAMLRQGNGGAAPQPA